MNQVPDQSFLNPLHSVLFTDLYALTMCQAYHAERMNDTSCFELIYREMPAARNYIVAAGLESVLDYLEHVSVSDEDVEWLRSLGQFSSLFLDQLKGWRFTGDVYAVPEGTIVFSNEPLVQVVAPLQEAQLVETMLINQVHFQSVLASKASRIVTAAADRTVIDFGARRAHGTDAAIKVARASYLVGAAGTSLVLAGHLYGIPVFGTMAHSYIQSHEDEAAAFRAFAQQFPNTTLLVDTYDTCTGVQKIIELSQQLGPEFSISAIRLDSGNIEELSRRVRQMLNEGGLGQVRLFASNELDEYQIAELVARGAPIDGFGVGTRLAVSDDVSHIDLAYKLVEYNHTPRTKLSSHKVIYPGRKQVFRMMRDNHLSGDVIARYDELFPGEPLLKPVMRAGQRLENACPALEESRKYAIQHRQQLPDDVRSIMKAKSQYHVEISERLRHDLDHLRNRLVQRSSSSSSR